MGRVGKLLRHSYTLSATRFQRQCCMYTALFLVFFFLMSIFLDIDL